MKSDKFFFMIQNLLKYLPYNWAIYLRQKLYKPFFKKFGKNIQIKDGVTFKYPSEIILGDNVIIGEYSYLVGKSGLYIGNDVLIGSGSKIITSNHEYKSINEVMRKQGLKFEQIVVCDDVWLGFDVKILSGSYIPKGCIIGTNTLVNKRLELEYSIYVGTPVKFIRHRKE